MKIRLIMSALLLGCWMSTTASAQLAPYSTDFGTPGGGPPYPDGINIGDGWKFFATQPPSGPYFGDAPNGPQMSALADFDGNQYINVYADYNNTALATAANPPGFTVNVFQERTFTAADAATGDTWTFKFDWKHADAGGPNGSTTAAAYIRVFDGSFNILTEQTFDTTAPNPSGAGFDPGSVSVAMNPGWTSGGIIQFGFTNTAGGWGAGTPDSSGVFYDNVNFTNVAPTSELAPFCTDFEDYATGALFAKIEDDWQFADWTGDFVNFFTDRANVNGPQMSKLADELGDTSTAAEDDGSPEIGGGGNKYLNVYSNYDRQSPGHATGIVVTVNIFQEQAFTGADAATGDTWTWDFDYANGNVSGATTTEAFVKVLDLANNVLLDVPLDTTAAAAFPTFTHGQISMPMNPLWVDGGKVQFGFRNFATNFNGSGIYYDNVDWKNFVRGDADGIGGLNFDDVEPFILALFDIATYNATFPGIDANSVLDMNCDGSLTFDDVEPFIAALF